VAGIPIHILHNLRKKKVSMSFSLLCFVLTSPPTHFTVALDDDVLKIRIKYLLQAYILSSKSNIV
jgi:hypothetical protein